MAGVDWLAISALVVSVIVAISQLSKEWRERKALSARENQAKVEAQESQTLLPIRGANEAVLALREALQVSKENEARLYARLDFLDKENDLKDQQIEELNRRVWVCERELSTLKGNN